MSATKSALLLMFCMILLLLSAVPAAADEPHKVSLPWCENEDVPAGVPVLFDAGWAVDSRRAMLSFMYFGHTVALLDHQRIENAGQYWGELYEIPDYDGDGDLEVASRWNYLTEPLEIGETRTMLWGVWLRRPITDGFDLDRDGQMDWYGPGWHNGDYVTCTVTGVAVE